MFSMSSTYYVNLRSEKGKLIGIRALQSFAANKFIFRLTMREKEKKKKGKETGFIDPLPLSFLTQSSSRDLHIDRFRLSPSRFFFRSLEKVFVSPRWKGISA